MFEFLKNLLKAFGFTSSEVKKGSENGQDENNYDNVRRDGGQQHNGPREDLYSNIDPSGLQVEQPPLEGDVYATLAETMTGQGRPETDTDVYATLTETMTQGRETNTDGVYEKAKDPNNFTINQDGIIFEVPAFRGTEDDFKAAQKAAAPLVVAMKKEGRMGTLGDPSGTGKNLSNLSSPNNKGNGR